MSFDASIKLSTKGPSLFFEAPCPEALEGLRTNGNSIFFRFKLGASTQFSKFTDDSEARHILKYDGQSFKNKKSSAN